MHSFIHLNNAQKNALRAGIAISLSILVVHFGHISFGYWLILTTIVVLQPTFGATLDRAKQRTVSTLLGVSIGAMIAVLIHSSLIAIAILLPILVFLCIIMMPYSYTKSIFFATIILMLVLSYNQADTWGYVFNRLYDTLIGVGIGLACSLFLWPSWARLKLGDNLCKSLKQSKTLFLRVTQCLIKHDPNSAVVNKLKMSLESLGEGNRQFLEQTTHETSFSDTKNAPAFAIVYTIEKIQSILNILHMLSRMDLYPAEPQATIKRLANIQKETASAFDIIVNIINGAHSHLSQTERQAFLELIKQTPDLEKNISQELRFLHRNINLLRRELNHLFQASLLFQERKNKR
jgi:uncharacterized membrane protein YccC